MIFSLFAVGFLLIPVFVLILVKKHFVFSIRILGGYVLLSITLLVLPYYAEQQSALYIFESLLHTMKSMVLNNDSTIVYYFSNQSVIYSNFYATLIYIFYVLSPLFTLGVSISFFEKKLNAWAYWLLSCFKKSIVFSEYSQKTLDFGQYLREKDKKVVIVYLINSKNSIDYTFLRSIKALAFEGQIHRLKYSSNNERVAYLLSLDELKNINDALAILDQSEKKPLFHDIHLMYKGEAPKVVFESKINGININWIDETLLCAEELLIKSPLYWAINQKNELNIMLIGLGNLGQAILKLFIMMSNINDKLKINIDVIDIYASSVKRQMMHISKNIYDELGVNFIDLDIKTYDFNMYLEKLQFRPSYIVIALSEQQQSIETSIFLRRFYEEKDNSSRPKIHVAIDNEETKKWLIDKLKEPFCYDDDIRDFDIISFGIYKENYRRYVYQEIELKLLTHISHLLYDHSVSQIKAMTYQNLLTSSKKLDMKNTRGFVFHLSTKLHLIGYSLEFLDQDIKWLHKNRLQYLEEAMPDYQSVLLELKKDLESNLDALVVLDGKRWKVSKRLDGYEPLSLVDVNDDIYQLTMKKKHARLGNIDDVELARKLSEYDYQYHDDFFANKDKHAILSIPSIILLYNEIILKNCIDAPVIMLKKLEKA